MNAAKAPPIWPAVMHRQYLAQSQAGKQLSSSRTRAGWHDRLQQICRGRHGPGYSRHFLLQARSLSVSHSYLLLLHSLILFNLFCSWHPRHGHVNHFHDSRLHRINRIASLANVSIFTLAFLRGTMSSTGIHYPCSQLGTTL